MQDIEDTGDNVLYARMGWYIEETIYKGLVFTKTNVNWNRMSLGFKSIVKDFPDQWNVQAYAYYACLAMDRDVATDIFKDIKPPIIMQIWGSDSFYNTCKDIS
ncbi:MAG: hypothetical protein D6698_06855, partial [Gammaproteobacteria bacterium]